MIRALQAEIIKSFSRPRSYIGLGAIVLLTGLIDVAFWFGGQEYIGLLFQSFDPVFRLEGNIVNGNLLCFIILQTLIIHLPLLVALITGDLLSGESAMGTMRYVLTRPISRARLVLVKWLTAVLYCLAILLLLGLFAYLGSLAIFGLGDLMVLNSDGLVILRSSELPWRFAMALGYAFLSLITIASLSLMFSAFAKNSIGPIVLTMLVVITFTIISSFEMSFFNPVLPLLFTNHMMLWRKFFADPIPFMEIARSAGVLSLHIAAFVGITLYHFRKKDILE